jgi:hypothetical protein
MHPERPVSRRASAPPPPPRRSPLPLVLGVAGGVAVLVLVVAPMAGGSRPSRTATVPAPARKADAPPPPRKPDVSALEAEGKSKCAAGMDRIQPRLNADPSAPRDRVWNDLEEGLKLLNAGLAAYRQAAEKAGKTYETDAFERTRKQAIRRLCTDLEKEAQSSCDKGYRIIQDSESLMTGKILSDAERASLVKTLEEGKKLIEAGMSLFDRSHQVSEHLFDTTQYGQALKMARGKLLELRK